jgi:hypothetical protein
MTPNDHARSKRAPKTPRNPPAGLQFTLEQENALLRQSLKQLITEKAHSHMTLSGNEAVQDVIQQLQASLKSFSPQTPRNPSCERENKLHDQDPLSLSIVSPSLQNSDVAIIEATIERLHELEIPGITRLVVNYDCYTLNRVCDEFEAAERQIKANKGSIQNRGGFFQGLLP